MVHGLNARGSRFGFRQRREKVCRQKQRDEGNQNSPALILLIHFGIRKCLSSHPIDTVTFTFVQSKLALNVRPEWR